MSALVWHPRDATQLLFSCGPHVLGLDTTALSLEEGELLSCDPASPPEGIRGLPQSVSALVTSLAWSPRGDLVGVGTHDGVVSGGPASRLHCACSVARLDARRAVSTVSG